MKVRMTGLAVLAAIALVSVMASSAFAIEAFQERFEWGDMSKPTTVHGRVAVTDPYDKACLLYTSPSPRDQRGARVAAGGW